MHSPPEFGATRASVVPIAADRRQGAQETPEDGPGAGARLTQEIKRLQSSLTDLRAQDRQRQAAITDLAEYQKKLEREIGRLNGELKVLRESKVWRLLGPLHAFAKRYPWLARQMLRSARIAWWTLTLQIHRRLPAMIAESRAARATTALRRVTPQDPPPAVDLASVKDTKLSVAAMMNERFEALLPFPIYRPGPLPPRLTLVTDSVNVGSLYGGVATSIIMAAELAKASGRKLRVLTRGDAPIQSNVHHVLANAGITYDDSIEFCSSAPHSTREVDVGDDDVFLTTSWWSTHYCTRISRPEKIVYLLQEDERDFYPAGDDRLRCTEMLANTKIRFVVNTKMLADHLGAEGFAHIARDGLSFEPAFPSSIYYPEAHDTSKLNFFFYARPHNLRNLFYRGIEVIDEAVQQGILDPDTWQIHFVGKDLDPKLGELPFRPVLVQNMMWSQYSTLVRRMDLGLSLMYTPHPSYPPLDLAASGAVVVTNRYGLKQTLDHLSRNIICADSDVTSLVEGLRAGAGLASDAERRLANYRASTFSRDWSASVRNVVATLSKQLCS
jgi:hypothetical protein